MRFDGAKSFPHPVLRPGSSDYEAVEFEVEIKVERIEWTTSVRIEVDFTLSDTDLLRLVGRELAQYVLVMRCAFTNFRRDLRTSEERVVQEFSDGEIAGELEITPFCVASSAIRDFKASCWNADYKGRAFDLPEGSVLAMDYPVKYWIDTADDSHIGSIFKLVPDPRERRGQWSCSPMDNKVEIHMHPQDFERFCRARQRLSSNADAYYLMNSVYLPAILYLLEVADTDRDELASKRWYTSLETRLRDLDCPPIGSESADRLRDAQAILENPFQSLPFLRED